MTEGNNLLISLGQRANKVQSPQEAEEMLQEVNRYIEEGKPAQDERLKKISELAVQLYGMCRILVVQFFICQNSKYLRTTIQGS